MVRGLVAGLVVAVVCSLAGCGSSAVTTSSHADTAGDGGTSSSAPVDAGSNAVDLDSMAGLVVSGDTAVLADSRVPTGFWTGATDEGGRLHELQGPGNPLWVKAIVANGNAVFVLGARCDEMLHSDPEVVCSPGTAQLWQLDVPGTSWRHLADFGDDDIAGARFLSTTPDEISLSVSTLPTPRSVQLHLYDVDLSSGHITSVGLPAALDAPVTNAQVVICGSADGDRVALAANDEQSDPSGGVDNRTGRAAWSMRASDGGWTEVSEPEGVPEGRMATIGCTGPSGSLTFAAGGAGRQTLLVDPGGSQWRAAATPPWLVPPMGSGPVLEVGNSGGMSFWTGRTLYRFDATTSKWAETRFDAPADVKAVALIGRDRIAAVSSGADHAPRLSISTS